MKPMPKTNQFIRSFHDNMGKIMDMYPGREFEIAIFYYESFIEESLAKIQEIQEEIYEGINDWRDLPLQLKYLSQRFDKCILNLDMNARWMNEGGFKNFLERLYNEGHLLNNFDVIELSFSQGLDKSYDFFREMNNYFDELLEIIKIPVRDPIVEETHTDILREMEDFWSYLIDHLENGKSDFQVFMKQWFVNPISENHPGTLQFKSNKKPSQSELVRKTEEFWKNGKLKRIIESKSHLIYHIVSSFHQRFERYDPKDAFDLDSNLYKLFKSRTKKSRT